MKEQIQEKPKNKGSAHANSSKIDFEILKAIFDEFAWAEPLFFGFSMVFQRQYNQQPCFNLKSNLTALNSLFVLIQVNLKCIPIVSFWTL